MGAKGEDEGGEGPSEFEPLGFEEEEEEEETRLLKIKGLKEKAKKRSRGPYRKASTMVFKGKKGG